MKVYRLDGGSKVCRYSDADGKGLVLRTQDAPSLAAKDIVDFGAERFRVLKVARRTEDLTFAVLGPVNGAP